MRDGGGDVSGGRFGGIQREQRRRDDRRVFRFGDVLDADSLFRFAGSFERRGDDRQATAWLCFAIDHGRMETAFALADFLRGAGVCNFRRALAGFADVRHVRLPLGEWLASSAGYCTGNLRPVTEMRRGLASSGSGGSRAGILTSDRRANRCVSEDVKWPRKTQNARKGEKLGERPRGRGGCGGRQRR